MNFLAKIYELLNNRKELNMYSKILELDPKNTKIF